MKEPFSHIPCPPPKPSGPKLRSENTGPPKGPLFHRAHYNLIAKQIRESAAPYLELYRSDGQNRKHAYSAVHGLTSFALNLAKRLLQDNPNFDPITFLDGCSPDKYLYPLSELWEDYIGKNHS